MTAKFATTSNELIRLCPALCAPSRVATTALGLDG
jgi:hypothetical protein